MDGYCLGIWTDVDTGQWPWVVDYLFGLYQNLILPRVLDCGGRVTFASPGVLNWLDLGCRKHGNEELGLAQLLAQLLSGDSQQVGLSCLVALGKRIRWMIYYQIYTTRSFLITSLSSLSGFSLEHLDLTVAECC